jgi:hypothetical protein
VLNVLVPGEGHLSILRSPTVVRTVVEHLLSEEQRRPAPSLDLTAA